MPQPEKSNRFSPRLPATVAIILMTVLSGGVHAYLSGGWGDLEEREERSLKLDSIPASVGGWHLWKQDELRDSYRSLLECHNAKILVYRQPDTGAEVHMSLLFGPSGPTAVHTPDLCYSSAGAVPKGVRTKTSVRGESFRHEFWEINFEPREGIPGDLRVYYAWTTGGAWVAAERPRFWLTNDMYKIQVESMVTDPSSDPAKDFLKAMLPELEKLIQE